MANSSGPEQRGQTYLSWVVVAGAGQGRHVYEDHRTPYIFPNNLDRGFPQLSRGLGFMNVDESRNPHRVLLPQDSAVKFSNRVLTYELLRAGGAPDRNTREFTPFTPDVMMQGVNYLLASEVSLDELVEGMSRGEPRGGEARVITLMQGMQGLTVARTAELVHPGVAA